MKISGRYKEKIKKKLYENIICLKKNREIRRFYSVELRLVDRLKEIYNSFECHFILYPYSRNITSREISFHPFDEYISDISTGHRSAYSMIVSNFNKVFGLILGASVVLVAYFCFNMNMSQIFSIEPIASIFGAYLIGKEVWDDLENILRKVTRNLKIKYCDDYYQYELEKFSTLTNYSNMAKRNRYDKDVILPEKIDFIPKSNSQTLRMFFNTSDMEDISIPESHLFSIHVSQEVYRDFEKTGYMFGTKLSFNKRFIFINKHFELFQSLSRKRFGALNENGKWYEDAVFFRRTFSIGHLKLYWRSGIIENFRIIEYSPSRKKK